MPHKLELQLQVVPVATTIPESGLGIDQASTAIRLEIISPAMEAINNANKLKLQVPVDSKKVRLEPSNWLRSE